LPHGIASGSQIDVAVHPENIVLTRAADGAVKGEITDHSFLGNLNEYQVKLANQILRVQTHSKENFTVGETVGIAVDPEAISIFEKN